MGILVWFKGERLQSSLTSGMGYNISANLCQGLFGKCQVMVVGPSPKISCHLRYLAAPAAPPQSLTVGQYLPCSIHEQVPGLTLANRGVTLFECVPLSNLELHKHLLMDLRPPWETETGTADS